MWFTALILLDLWLAYLLISWLISLHLVAGAPDAIYWLGVPFLYYWGPRLPEWPRFRRFRFWNWVRRVYFRGTKVPMPVSQNQVLYVAYPHGMYGESVSIALLNSDAFADVLPVCSSVLFAIPILRELASLMGAVHANAKDMKAALEAGRSLLIFPEGMRGALGAPPRLLLEKRTGYIALAKSARCPNPLVLAPLKVHHEKGPAYQQVCAHGAFQLWTLSWLRYPWPMIHWGQWGTFLPKRQRITFLVDYNVIPITAAASVQDIHAKLLKRLVL